MEKPERLGVERPEGLGHGPQEGSVPAYHGGAELGASRTVGSITDVGQIGRTEQAGGDSGLQSETGCAMAAQAGHSGSHSRSR